MKISTALCLFGNLLSLEAYSQSAQDEVVNLARSLQPEQFFGHMEVLASDSLEGRGTGSKGYDKAAEYIINNAKSLGLQPGALDGSYIQPVAFETRQIKKESVILSFSKAGKTLLGEYGNNISILPNIKSPEINLEKDVVFVGFGLDIPELGINDYQGVDVKGKIVLLSFGFPDNIDKKKYGKYMDPFAKLKLLEKKGVAGVIFFTRLGVLQKLIFKSVHGFFKDPFFDFDENDLSNPMISFDNRLLIFSKREFIENLFKLNELSYKKTIKSMKQGAFKPFVLGSSLKISYSAKVQKVMSKNIVAILPGSDPALSSEYLVLSAHLDHLGIGKPVKNDSIYNGAWDNASGSSTLLSIAETYKQLPVAPKRSIIFLWVTAEEKGLMGSHYYAQKPTVPANKIVADMSLDMAGGIFKAKDIIPMGYKMSNLSTAVDFATRSLNFQEDTTSSMENEYFERSDHFSFVNAGIPALLIFSGMTAVDPKINGKKTYDKWEKKVYHSPSDDMKQGFDREALFQGVRVNFLISWYIANEIPEIKWNTASQQYKKYILK